MSLFNEGCLNHYYTERLCSATEGLAVKGMEFLVTDMAAKMLLVDLLNSQGEE